MNTKKLLACTVLKNRGFVLAYTLYLLCILLSISLILAESVKEKADIEKQLKMIEKEKDIELAIYSYFVYNPVEDDFCYNIEDYTISYNSYKLLTNVYLDATITNEEHSYTVTYTYSTLTKKVNEINYTNNKLMED